MRKKATKQERELRIYAIIQLIRKGKHSCQIIEGLTKQLGISERQAKRDISMARSQISAASNGDDSYEFAMLKIFAEGLIADAHESGEFNNKIAAYDRLERLYKLGKERHVKTGGSDNAKTSPIADNCATGLLADLFKEVEESEKDGGPS